MFFRTYVKYKLYTFVPLYITTSYVLGFIFIHIMNYGYIHQNCPASWRLVVTEFDNTLPWQYELQHEDKKMEYSYMLSGGRYGDWLGPIKQSGKIESIFNLKCLFGSKNLMKYES